jgi:ACS family glucarate transporter-like MFS transporter
MLAVISATTYLDRLNLSIAGKSIQDQFAFNTETMGWILSAFVLGYALFQVPGGWIGDRYGPRNVLTVAILWWSVFTAVTAVAPHLPLAGWFGAAWSFAIVRFLIGVGEGAAFPNANKVVGYWSSSDSRGIANSIFFAGVGVGGTVTPIVITWIMVRWGWQTSFYLCAGLGVMVALVWQLYATDRPEEHPRVNSGELALINLRKSGALSRTEAAHHRPPWTRMFRSVSVWGLILSYLCIGYPAYIYHTWFFIYLVRVRGFSVARSGLWGSTPYLAIALLAPLGGWASDRAVASWGRRRGRQRAVWLGVTLSAIVLSAGGHITNRVCAVLLLAAAAGFNLFAVPTWWATCNDLTPNFCGSLSGLMNMCGNIGGWLSPIVTAYIATRFGWSRALDFAALLTLAAGLLWTLVNAGEALDSPLAARD